MGKHERGKAEATERTVVKLINENEISSEEKEKGYEEIARLTTEKIRSDFSNMKSCKHAGNAYDSLGDIIVEDKNGEKHFLELKFVKNGNGTMSNMGQDTLTNFDLFKNASSWSEFREKNNHDTWVREKLDKFNYSSEELDGSNGTKTRLYSKAKHLKKVIGCKRGEKTAKAANRILNNPDSSENQLLAAEIVKEIIEKDRDEKIKYLNHLQDKEQNRENVKKLSLLIIAGIHTQELLKEHWDIPIDQLEEELMNYVIYYGRKDNSEVERETVSSLLKGLLDEDFYVDFEEDQTHVSIKVNEGETERKILTMAFNWKNKFQGIQTPSLNVFEESGLKKASNSSESKSLSNY